MPDETPEQTRIRLIRIHKEEQDRRMLEKQRELRDPSLRVKVPRVGDTPFIERPHKVKRGVNNDPRINAYKKGDLVQVTGLYIKRQRGSSIGRKTEETRGIYYGPAKQGRYVYVDWFASEPWDHLHRQVIRIDYIEPLGTPR